MSRVFGNGPGDRGSILRRVIPKTKKMVLDVGSRVKWSNPGKEVAPYPNIGVEVIENGAFVSLSTKVANFTYSQHSLVYSDPEWLYILGYYPRIK